jgi:hypothetical protein
MKSKYVKGDYPKDLRDVMVEICKYYNEEAPEKVSLEPFIKYCLSKKVDVLISEGKIKCNWEPDAFIDSKMQIKEIKDRVEPLGDFPM